MLAVLTFRQSRIYADLETLYKAVIAGNPDCWLAHGNLGEELANQGRIDEAIVSYRKALAIFPECVESRNNLGRALARLGRFDEAIAEYRGRWPPGPVKRQARPFATTWPRPWSPAAGSTRPPPSIARCWTINPSWPCSTSTWATCWRPRVGSTRPSPISRRPWRINPELSRRGRTSTWPRAQRERLLKTLADWRQSLRANPDDVAGLNNVAWWLATNPNASIRNGPEAVELAQRAVRLSGGRQPAILSTLAAAYAEAGRFSEAVETAQQALDLARGRTTRNWQKPCGAGFPSLTPELPIASRRRSLAS